MITLFPSRQVAISIINFDIHWYGILYLLAFLIAYILLPRLSVLRKCKLSHEDWASLLTWSVLGVILGGRLGYVLLYEPAHFAAYPMDIFKVWNGGMSFHGGFAGVALLLSFALWKRDISFRRVADVVVIPAAIGLALGRMGNFINQELYGTVSTLPWAMNFPGALGERHPLQLYGVLKDLFIAGTCYLYLIRRPFVPGRTFALFLILYGFLRFSLEFLRAQQHSLFDLGFFTITRGQAYTLPILILGIILWFKWKDTYEK